MPLTLDEVLQAREEELANLKKMAERYPKARYVKGRLYEVDQFHTDDKPTNIVLDEDEVVPCVVFGDPNNAGIFLMSGYYGLRLKAATVVALIFRLNPEVVLKVLG